MTLTTVNPALLDTQAQYNGFKNRIINGAMGIWQRGTSFSGLASNATSATYTTDRFACNKGNGSTGVVTFSQSSDVPTGSGLPYSLLVTVTTTAASMNSTEYNAINQVIEGFNIADLAYGTASAATSVLSFWAKASVTGTYCGTLIQRGAATQRAYPFTYTVSAANTWTQYFISVSGDTSGTLLYNNAAAFEVDWYYGIGSSYASGVANTWNVNTSANQYVSTTGVNMLATNGATLRITGVQLEKGSTATSFDYRPFGTEVALCQRYFTTSFQNGATPASPNSLSVAQTGLYFINGASSVSFPVLMRTAPTVTCFAPLTSPAINNVRVANTGAIAAGTVAFIGEKSFTQFGPTDGVAFQFGYTASAEL